MPAQKVEVEDLSATVYFVYVFYLNTFYLAQ